MIELRQFSVRGLRSLADVSEIPVRGPTIVKGANDGGKSTVLRGLEFLLGGRGPSEDEFTVLGARSQRTEPLRTEWMEAVGVFDLNEPDCSDFHTASISLRRIATLGGEARYEWHQRAPTDIRLRDLETLGLAELQARAEEYGIAPIGRRNMKKSWLDPLRAHAQATPHQEIWISAPSALVARLPHFISFSSTAEPDPEGQIQTALRAAYAELLAQDNLTDPIRRVEAIVQERLAASAASLCDHIAARCPELDAINVQPDVAFRDAFRQVRVLTRRPGGAEIPLNQSGAGRRRRINLAVWEWMGNLLNVDSSADRSVVIAYDEPDTHLDYGHQRELVELIQQQCAKPGVRMLIATHSLNLIDRVDIEDVVLLRLQDEQTIIERLVGSGHAEIDQYLSSISEAMGLRNSVLLHERSFLGVEGPTEVQTIPTLFRLATGMSLQSAGIALIAGNGNDGALNVIRWLREHGRRLAFAVVDSDSTDRKLFRPDKLHAAGITNDEIHLLGSRELEDLFTDEQWAKAANRHWPRDDGVDWLSADFAALRNSPKFSKAIQNVVRGASSLAPERKQALLTGLVFDLASRTDVPAQLTALFDGLVAP